MLTIVALLVVYTLQGATPRLVVAIMVDGLGSNELEAYRHVMSERGLLYLIGQGVYSPASPCQYQAYDIGTHYASLFTGSTPRYHGIVSERFYSMVDDNIVSCIDDARYSGINSTLSVSPRLLQSTTLADQIKLTYPGSKVYSIGLRAESSIIMGGHLADGAIWLDDATSRLATTNFYNNGMPAWAEKVNNDSSILSLYRSAWHAGMPLYQYNYPTAVSYYGENKPAFQKFSVTDHTQTLVHKLRRTPMVNDLMKDLAIRALRDEQLGTDNAPDMLCVEFSARIPSEGSLLCAEKEDLMMRLDQNICRLIEAIDISVGLDNSIIIFAAPSTYTTPSTDMPDKINHGIFKAERSMALLNAYLMAIYGQGRWVTGYYNQNIHLNKSLIEKSNIRYNEICDYTAQFITEFSGVHSAMPAYQIRMASSMPYDLPARMRNSHYKNRSGDVVFTLIPGYSETTLDGTILAPTLTTPSFPASIIIPDVAPRRTKFSIEDICTTVCSLLNIPPTNASVGNNIFSE